MGDEAFDLNFTGLNYGIPTQHTGFLPNLNISSASNGASYTPNFVDKLLGWQDKTGVNHMGFGLPALGAANALFQGWVGMKQLDLAKQSLSEQKRQFDMNWGAQSKSYNNQLTTRLKQLQAADPSYKNVDETEYMAKWGIK